MRLTPEDAELDRFIVLLQKKTDKGIHQCESRNYEPSTNHKGQHFTTKFPFKMEKWKSLMKLSKNRIFSQKIDKSNEMVFKNVIINKKYKKKLSDAHAL